MAFAAVAVIHRMLGRQIVLAGKGQGDFQGKNRAAAFLALRIQGAAHAFGQGARNRQAQAGAAVATGDRVISLLEGIEHMLQALWRDADAAVVHGATEPQHFGIQRLPAGFDADGAFLGELQRIAQQVDQNLPDARRVALDHQFFQPRLSVYLQFQPALAGAVLEHLGRALDQFQQVEGDALQLQRAALDTGEVEDVVDHLEQVLGGLGGQRRVLGLLVVEFGGFQQLQHAQHAVHGGAQLVAHHRQEVRLGAVGLLGFLTRFYQLGNALLLLQAGLFQAAGQVVDMPCQAAEFVVVHLGHGGAVVAGLNRFHRIGHAADRL